MSSIVFSNKSLAIASGLRWSVLNAQSSRARSNAVGVAGRSVGATKFIVDHFDDQAYLGLYTPGISGLDLHQGKHRNVHALALVFLQAILQSSEADRSMLYGILSVSPHAENQGDVRAIVIIEGGRITHDGLETRARAVEIINEQRTREQNFQLFSDQDEYDDATLVELGSLIEYATRQTLTAPVPRNPAQYAVVISVLLGLGLYGAYYTLVTLPAKRAEEARKKAEQDRTPLYLQALEDAMQKAGWAVPSMVASLEKLNTDAFFFKGWALKGLDCNVNGCTESWGRHGGTVTQLMEMRPGSSYLPERSVSDKEAVVQMPFDGEPAKLTHEMITLGKINTHKILKPVLNKLENAGATGQFGETMTWPAMQMTGVRPDVIVKRTRLEIAYKHPFAVETLKEMPSNFIPENFVLSTEQGMSISIKGFIYEK